MEKENKARLLLIKEILEKYSDENHPLTTYQIIDLLKKEYDMSIHRTTVAKDISTLKELGIDVLSISSTQNKYFIASRKFELPELKLLIDAVTSSKFITSKKSDELVSKLSDFASIHQVSSLKRNLSSESRIKSENKYIYYIIDTINDAINSNKKISFKYFEYNVNKEKQIKNNGEAYILSPYCLVWNGDYYYTVGFSDKHDKIATFRVDRIYSTPEILNEKAIPAPDDFNISNFTRTAFQMYDSLHEEVELKCTNNMMKIIIDRFGENVYTEIIDDNHFMTRVEVALSPNFFGWVFSMSGQIQIISPEVVKTKYIDIAKKSFNFN